MTNELLELVRQWREESKEREMSMKHHRASGNKTLENYSAASRIVWAACADELEAVLKRQNSKTGEIR